MITTEKAEKSREKQSVIEVMDGGVQRRLEFVQDRVRMRVSRAGKNDITSSLKAEVGDQDEIVLSYFNDGTLLVSRYRYYPVTTSMTVHLARHTEEGKRRAIAYVLKAMSEVLQDEDVNEELDI